MRFRGRVYRDGKFWLAEVPVLDALTQGRSRKDSLLMIADWIESMVDRPRFKALVYPGRGEEFEVGSADTRGLVALLLQRQRQMSGLSLAEAAQRLGVHSRNAYARYERGSSVPTLEKLHDLLRAVAPDQDFVLSESNIH
ncbi:MAG TPA: helix-turn-helix transcriptional regulator [Planctomycetaceae bacterium]|nr:helix-turn-helix transcriptional regulator [Planctomycetaceae bacterium]